MKSQRVLALVKKDLKKLIREPATLFLILLFPVVLTLAFGLSFGAIGGSQPVNYQIGVVNTDNSGSDSQWSQYFMGNLTQTGILKLQSYSNNATAQSDLSQGKLQAVLVIPSNFGASCRSFQTAPNSPSQWINTTVSLYVDGGSMIATQAIPPIVRQVLDGFFGGHQTATPTPIQVGSPSLVLTRKYTTFDYFAPGIFAYAAIFLTMTVAQSFAADRDSGVLRRVNTTPTSPSEFMTSQTISNMIAGLIQIILVFMVAFLVGYRPQADLAGTVMAFLIVLVFALCNVGFGLITATISRSAGAATGISFLFIMPQMFLGTFVGLDLSAAAATAGRFVPAFYVTDAITSLFLRGAAATSPAVLTDLLVVSATSIAVLLVGILLFRRYGRT